jgi:hypothetical protein
MQELTNLSPAVLRGMIGKGYDALSALQQELHASLEADYVRGVVEVWATRDFLSAAVASLTAKAAQLR